MLLVPLLEMAQLTKLLPLPFRPQTLTPLQPHNPPLHQLRTPRNLHPLQLPQMLTPLQLPPP